MPKLNLSNNLPPENYLRFYEIMNYPVPLNSELYYQYYHNDMATKADDTDKIIGNMFSREEKSKYMDEYLMEIKRLENVFKSIPFVEQIFLCNSISFNALDNNSDIDLFIISKPGRIRSVKFWSMLLFMLKGAKRIGKNSRKKICLSFFVTSDNQNLYPISLPSIDIYLAYRIAHLVLIYQPEDYINNKIFSHNKWVQGILPNYQEQQTIHLGIDPIHGNTKFKNICEKIGNGFLGDIFEQIVKIIQKIIIRIKISKNPELNKDVIISDSMLKFHQDLREKISLKYNLKIKN